MPATYTESGYRMYDDVCLERLQHILLFKELQFPIKEIKDILDSSDFNRNRALEQQIELLTMKKEHLENLILFARGILACLGKMYSGGGSMTENIDAAGGVGTAEFAAKAIEIYCTK